MTLEPRLVKCNDLSRFVVVVVFSPDKLGICKRSYTPKYIVLRVFTTAFRTKNFCPIIVVLVR